MNSVQTSHVDVRETNSVRRLLISSKRVKFHLINYFAYFAVKIARFLASLLHHTLLKVLYLYWTKC